jgi:hypothetical protein
MTVLKAIVKNGKIELEAPDDWPEGTEVRIEPIPAAGSMLSRITLSSDRPLAEIGKFRGLVANLDDPSAAALFARFASQALVWRADTEFLSSPAEMANHPAYLEIVAMGEPAVPLILAELEARPDFWFEALRRITGADPVPPEARGDVRAMAEAWLEWGHSHGHRA